MDSLDSFVTKTKDLLELEREAELEETRVLQENVSAKDLEHLGVCLTRLRIASSHTGLYGRTVLCLEPFWPGRDLPAHSFTPGDIVGLSLSPGDNHNEALGSGIVARVLQTAVSVAFDESYDTSNLDDAVQYKIVKLANDVTYRRLKRALTDLQSYRGGPSSNLRDVMFGEAELGPPYSTQRDGPDTFHQAKLEFFNQRLDESQQEAVRFALSQRELAIVHGPPGTGKTTTIVEIILQAVKQGLKVLACAPSNVAVDNLVERLAAYKSRVIRLGHPARLLESIRQYALDAVLRRSDEAQVTEGLRQDLDKALSRLRKSNTKAEKQQLRSEVRLIRKDLKQQEAVAMAAVLKQASIICATLTSASNDGPLKHLDSGHFDLVVIDECSQAVEAACWIPLLRGSRAILAGDHHQLPPTIISRRAAKEGLAFTLMERQLKLHGGEVMRMLTMQYRMNAAIMTWSSDQLYDSKLKAHTSVANHLLSELPGVSESEETCSPLLLVDTAGCDLWELEVDQNVSKGNEGEADLAAAHIQKLIQCGVNPASIAVIAPYNLQVELLRLQLSEKYPTLEIKSVDSFQGREKEAVVISLVRSNSKGQVGFLSEDRRINVAITRARRHLAVICDSETVGHHKFLQSLIEYMQEHGEVRSAQQYIQDGTIDPTAKRPQSLQAKINASTVRKEAQKVTKEAQKVTKEAQKVSKNKKKPSTEGNKEAAPKLMTEKSTEQKEDGTSEDDEEEEALKHILAAFLVNDSLTEHVFPVTLSSRQRYLVHEISEQLGINHTSFGEGEERHIVVSKRIGGSQGHPIKPTAPANVKDSTPGDKTQKFNQECSGGNGKVEKEHLKRRERTSETPQSPPPVPVQPGLVQCQTCRKVVPQENLNLHRMCCASHEDAVKNSAQVKENVSRPATSKNKKKKNKPLKGTPAGQPEEDFDAVLAAAVKENTTCSVDRCKENAKILGQNCPFCGRRFCISHSMAEVHGCGAAAKSHARQMISREGVLYQGSGVPDKKPDPVKRAHLHRKLETKLENLSSKRKTKSKEK